MRLLIIGDSHCRTITNSLRELFPQIMIYSISVGSQIPAITFQYRAELIPITNFRPDHAIIHMGHNDLAWHPSKNKRPAISRDVSRRTIALANEILLNHPNIMITISTVFPRSYKRDSVLNKIQVVKFNTTAKRHGQRLTTRAREAGHMALYTKALWKKISIALEEPTFFRLDGLHLNEAGTNMIAMEWSTALGLVQ
jgi:lysophospholipase L1-like esterase